MKIVGWGRAGKYWSVPVEQGGGKMGGWGLLGAVGPCGWRIRCVLEGLPTSPHTLRCGKK